MKNLLLLFSLCFASSYLAAQQNRPCSCILLFAEELEEINPKEVLDVDQHIKSKFNQLKRESEEFKACVDFYSLGYNMWSLGKLRITLQMSGCKISKKAKKMLEEGPIIYEMNFKLEKQIKEQHKSTTYQKFNDSAIISNLLSASNRFVMSRFENDADYYFQRLPNWYINFFGKEEITNTLQKARESMDKMGLKTELNETGSVHYLLQKDSTLTTLIVHKMKLMTKDTTMNWEVKTLAISENLGRTWNLVDVTRDKLQSFWALNKSIDPIALENKLNEEGSTQYAAKNGTELAEHFCNCVKDIDKDDFLKEMECSGIITQHLLWQKYDLPLRKEVYNYVKENCSDYKNSLLFYGIEELEKY